MHIVIDTAPVSEKQKAGVGTYTLNLLRAFAKLDRRNSYTIYSMRLEQEKLGITDDNFKVRTVPDLFKFLPFWYSWTFWYYTGFPAQLSADKPDVFLSTYPVLPLRRACPSVVVIYDLSPLIQRNAFKADFQFRFDRQARHASKHADRIITISQSTKVDLVNLLGAKSENVHVVYPGYDGDIFKPKNDLNRIKEIMQKYKVAGNYILYIGTLEPKKNIPRLIEAFASLKKKGRIVHKLVIAGKRAWGDEAAFQAVTGNGLEGEVVFTGYVPQEELPLLMSGADVFVFPSLHEGFGIPPLEAMACGTPVITSNSSSLPEVVGDAGMLVNPYSVDEIAAGIYKVVSDSKLRERMRGKGLERAKLFSWERAGREVLKLLEDCYHSQRNQLRIRK